MQLIITDAWWNRSRMVYLNGLQLMALLVASAFTVMLLAAGLYHWVFLKGAREGWPLIGSLVRLVVKDEFDQRERYVRQNIDVMARRLGEMQVKLLQLESLGERVSGLAGVKPTDLKIPPGQGGSLIPGPDLSLTDLQSTLDSLDALTQQRTDVFTVLESRLFERKIRNLRVPTQMPTANGEIGSVFGWRLDPITLRSALHTGLDFRGNTGEPIWAAAGGVVVTQEYHPEYGNMVEIDHGNDLMTRYAHASRVLVKAGDLIRRGQKIAEVGNSGRSTGAHMHFEVLVQGVPQDPQKFLQMGRNIKSETSVAAAKMPAKRP